MSDSSQGTESAAPVSSVSDSGVEDLVDIPAVVAVVVACNPGEHFAETLGSLGDQDYENLSVLVVDAGSDAPIADRVAAVLPEAYLHRLAGDPGYSVAANQSIELVSGSPFLLFCHDDVALAPDCVSQLMGELYRSNGGIAGPKLVRWADDRKLLQLGMGSDRFGVMVDQVEIGEFDQDQYDAVRDVFVVPGGVQLIRADLFAALGGFDPTIKIMGEDLDLCWRAHAAGARVLAVPAAKARHQEAMSERISLRERRRLLTRHRLRTVLAVSTRRSFLVVITAFLLILLESLYSLIAGRRGQARDVLGAITWNLARLDDLRRKRRQLRRVRTVSDQDIAKLQAGGSARLAAFSRGQFSAGQDRFSGMVGSVRSSFRGDDAGSVRDATVIGSVLAVLLIFGSRHLLTRGVAPVGQIPDVPGAMTLLREWLGGWRTVGTGGPGNAPSALPILAGGRMLFWWGPGIFDSLLVVLPVFLGPIGAYRLARPLASARAGAIGALVYAGNPLTVAAISAGRWEALVLIAAAPFVLGALLRVGGYAPYGSDHGNAGPSIADRNLPVRLIRFAFLIAFLAAFVPAVVPIAVVLCLVFALSSLALGAGGAPERYLLAALVSVVGTVALHGPWSFDFLQGLSWRWLIGPDSPEADVDSLLELLQFAPGAPAARLIALGIVVAAAIGLLVARAHHFHLAAAGWLVAIVFWGLIWSGRRGWLPFELPTAEAMLAPVAAGLTLAIVVGVRGLELMFADPASRRIINRTAGGVGGVAVAGVLFTGMLSSLSGAWEAPTQSFSDSTQFLVRQQQSENTDISTGRVLWIGDASVMPLDVAVSDMGTEYAVSDGGRTEARGRWLARPVGATNGIGAQLDLASQGEVVRLGRLLAPYGIDNVVVVKQLAPAPYTGPQIEPAEGIERALSQQLDLERVPGVPNLIVFRNTSSNGITPLLPSAEAAMASTAVEQLDIDLTNKTVTAPIINYQPGRWVLNMPEDTDVLLALDSTGLEATGVRSEVSSGFDDLAVLSAGPGGEVLLEYGPSLRRQLALVGQVMLVLVGAVLAQTRREVSV
ncbi:MAG: glycosyltransferase family 2 protein [Actinomycetota bacterium]